MAFEQSVQDSNLWNMYASENSAGTETPFELSSANLQSYNQKEHYDLTKTASDNEIANSLNQTLATINQTQNEINFIKQELGNPEFMESLDLPCNKELKEFTIESMKGITSDSTSFSSNMSNTSPLSSTSQSDLAYQQSSSDIIKEGPAEVQSNSTIKNGKNDLIQKNSKKETKVTVDKRKSQNRAAQRAFRERKEKKLKELEDKLNESEKEKYMLLEEIEKLKLKNIIITTENQTLLKDKSANGSANEFSHSYDNKYSNNLNYGNAPNNFNVSYKFQFPRANETYDVNLNERLPENFYTGKSLVYNNPLVSNERLLSTQAVWNYLSEFEELNSNYELDFEEIMKSLEGKAKCIGLGPGYSLDSINSAIKDYFLKTAQSSS